MCCLKWGKNKKDEMICTKQKLKSKNSIKLRKMFTRLYSFETKLIMKNKSINSQKESWLVSKMIKEEEYR